MYCPVDQLSDLSSIYLPNSRSAPSSYTPRLNLQSKRWPSSISLLCVTSQTLLFCQRACVACFVTMWKRANSPPGSHCTCTVRISIYSYAQAVGIIQFKGRLGAISVHGMRDWCSQQAGGLGALIWQTQPELRQSERSWLKDVAL